MQLVVGGGGIQNQVFWLLNNTSLSRVPLQDINTLLMVYSRLYFSKVAMAILLVLYFLPECSHCSIERWGGSISFSVSLGSPMWPPIQTEYRKTNDLWLLWQGHKKQYRVSMALSLGTVTLGSQLPYCEEDEAPWRQSVGIPDECQHQTPQWTMLRWSDPPPPHTHTGFPSCLSSRWLEQGQAVSSIPAQTTDSWTT